MGIAGRWYNELGSEMNLAVSEDGRITGSYQTRVADRPLPPPRMLVGLTDRRPKPGRPQSVAFVVEWGHPDGEIGSVTAWSGQLHVVAEGDGTSEVLVTTWLLTTETARRDEWTSTLVGHDTFTRASPEPAAMSRARALRRALE